MKTTVLNEIIEMCLNLDEVAAELYLEFAQDAKKRKLATFWEEMSREESDHVEACAKLLNMARLNMMPQVFENVFETKQELEEITARNRQLIAAYRKKRKPADAFFTAFNLEFHLLHPAFITLQRYYLDVLGDGDGAPDIHYPMHLQKFNAAVKTFGQDTPEIDLLAQTIERLYRDNALLVRQSRFDMLTGVRNRRGFFDTALTLANLARRNGYTVGLLLVDIDNLRSINRELGHESGDRVLASVAKQLASLLRHSDVIGRYSGEAFAIFLSQVEPDALPSLAEHLRQSVVAVTHAGQAVTVCIGAVEGAIDDDALASFDHLLRIAGVRLARAQKRGPGRIVLDDQEA